MQANVTFKWLLLEYKASHLSQPILKGRARIAAQARGFRSRLYREEQFPALVKTHCKPMQEAQQQPLGAHQNRSCRINMLAFVV